MRKTSNSTGTMMAPPPIRAGRRGMPVTMPAMRIASASNAISPIGTPRSMAAPRGAALAGRRPLRLA